MARVAQELAGHVRTWLERAEDHVLDRLQPPEAGLAYEGGGHDRDCPQDLAARMREAWALHDTRSGIRDTRSAISEKTSDKPTTPQSLADRLRAGSKALDHDSFGATTQAILKTKPFEFSAAGLSDLDMDALRADSARAVLDAMEREGFDLSSGDGQQRALAVLFGYLNQAQQAAMGIEFYVWNTQHDARVREGHAERDGEIFRWDDPPEGGHPSQDFGCRCYARALGVEGYWARVSEGVDAFTADIGHWEGSVDHMYLDTEDNVTVGIGTLLATSDAAAALAFRHRDTGELATEAEIRAEFDLIDGMLGSQERGAEYYRDFTSLYLPQDQIDGLVIEHMRGDFAALLRMFPYFGDFPLPAQIALWDMIYNLGSGGLRREFPLMRQAIQDGDWEEAARQSHRGDIGEPRNDHVRDLFMEAAEGD